MVLTDDNYVLYAMQAYDNPYCLNEDEFHSDLRKVHTLARGLKKYRRDRGINLRLLVNNFISYYNVFESKAATKMLFHKLDKELYGLANAVLHFLSLPQQSKKVDKNFLKVLQEEIQ